MNLTRRGVCAVEAVQHQNDVFFKELVSIITDAKRGDLGDTSTMLEAAIKNRMNLPVQIVVDTTHGPSVEIPEVNKNNVLVSAFYRNFTSNVDGKRMIKNATTAACGGVDLKRGTVSGIFTSLTKTIYLPIRFLYTYRFTAEEITAALLHEIGHLFTYYEFLARTVTTNQVLAAIARAMDGSDSAVERLVVLQEAKDALRLKDLDVDALANTSSSSVVQTVVITNTIKQARSELGSDIYDCNNWEFLADQFAERMGAGRHLVTALQKLYSGNISMRSTSAYLAVEALKIIALAGSLAAMAVVPAAGLYFMLIGWIYVVLDGPGDPTYDRPGVRMKRIRNQLVERLKASKSLSEGEISNVKKDIEFIDESLKDVNDRLSFYHALARKINKGLRNRLDAEELQQELESLVSNDLFVKSITFRY